MVTACHAMSAMVEVAAALRPRAVCRAVRAFAVDAASVSDAVPLPPAKKVCTARFQLGSRPDQAQHSINIDSVPGAIGVRPAAAMLPQGLSDWTQRQLSQHHSLLTGCMQPHRSLRTLSRPTSPLRKLGSTAGLAAQPLLAPQSEDESWSGRPSDVPSGRRAAGGHTSTAVLSPLTRGGTAETVIELPLDSKYVFDACWRRFEERFRLKQVHVPREVVWLNGAPGAGKGANTQHVLKTRGLDHSVCVSSLLKSDKEASGLIERGEMVPDSVVVDLVLEALLINGCESPECGILVDGFPRTAMQVDFLKLLGDKLTELHVLWANSPHRERFPRPLFKVVMLYVDEETSITRQLERAKVATVHNKRVIDAGAGELWAQRTTDLSVDTCKKRYDIFRQHHSAVLRLKQFFPFHLIDAMGSLAETQEAITTELRYQSSLDLSYETYASIRHLPLAQDLTQSARQQLVMRLDAHSLQHRDAFRRVIDIITSEIMPLIRESGLSGRAEYVTENRLFNEQPRAAQMLIDILTDRGYGTSHSSEKQYVPVSMDMTTGQIRNRCDVRHRFQITWDVSGVRDMASRAMELAAGLAEVTVKNVRISQSFVPTHYGGRNAEPKALPDPGNPNGGNGSHAAGSNGSGDGSPGADDAFRHVMNGS